jgi:acetate kinase
VADAIAVINAGSSSVKFSLFTEDAALRGLDAIVFTAGIGENSHSLRERVCRDAG